MREPWTEAAQRDQGVGQAQGPPHITHSRASPTGSTWPETKAEDLARPGIASRVRGHATGRTGWLGWVHGHAAHMGHADRQVHIPHDLGIEDVRHF